MTIVRLAPSGPPILNDNGTPLEFGEGARLRMDDIASVIGDGSEPIPTAKSLIRTAGFSGLDATAVIVELASPKVGARYGAELVFDVINTSTNIDLAVDLFLDVSVDDGATWAEIASNQHHAPASADLTTDVNSGRQVSLYLPLTLGSALGVLAASPSIKLRASASQPAWAGAAGCELYSPLTAGASTHSKGTFYMKIEECF